MKIVFLDIDGVLNDMPHVKELWAKKEAGEISNEEYWEINDLPYEATLLALQKIIQETGAKIVLSSSWRVLPGRVKQLENIFKKYNLSIYSKTEDGVSIPTLKNILYFDISKCHTVYEGSQVKYTTDRGAEIMLWLSEHPNVENFVILDDEIVDIKKYYKGKYVQTSFFKGGLNMRYAKKAIKILNKKGK